MKNRADKRVRQISIKVAGQVAGLLEKDAQFKFTYHSEAQTSVAAAMPVKERSYQHGALFPIFEMNIPEGYLRHRITERLRKHIRVDEMLFLALQGGTGLGHLAYLAEDFGQQENSPEKLSEILAWEGDTEIFDELVNKYLLQANISGVQPKVMVPELVAGTEKGTLILPTIIVKSEDEEYPQLALNEYICMRLAKACQISTPEFWLSADQRLFVMRRFDLKADGTSMAMEDMAVLQGKSTDQKYQSSYAAISKVLGLYSSNRHSDNEKLFRMMVHSCMVGNGDAHLKNYAMLYNHLEDMRISPLYDVVNTQIYNPKDTMALSLGKSRAFPGRKRIIDFGKSIGVKLCGEIVDNMADQIRDELEVLSDYTAAMSLDIKSDILNNVFRSTT